MQLNLQRLLPRIIYLILSIIMIWILGFVVFLYHIPNNVKIPMDETDAIVILTGGSSRLEEGLNAFSAFKNKKLLISGVGGGITFKELLGSSSNHHASTDENVTLGNIAVSTLTNAKETKIFMNLNNFKSLRLVTSSYHMLRSKLIFEHVMPNIHIIYHPVYSSNFKYDAKYLSLHSYFVIFTEYNKYIVTSFLIELDNLSDYWDIGIIFIATYIKQKYLQLID